MFCSEREQENILHQNWLKRKTNPAECLAPFPTLECSRHDFARFHLRSPTQISQLQMKFNARRDLLSVWSHVGALLGRDVQLQTRGHSFVRDDDSKMFLLMTVTMNLSRASFVYICKLIFMNTNTDTNCQCISGHRLYFFTKVKMNKCLFTRGQADDTPNKLLQECVVDDVLHVLMSCMGT